MTYFHVHVPDSADDVVEAGHVWRMWPPEGDAAAEFPEGLTMLGLRHAASSTRDQQQAIELLAEAVRRLVAPQAPSRFQSVYAFEALHDARGFAARFRAGDEVAILNVEGECGHRGDIDLLTGLAVPGARSLINARRYWQGDVVGGPRECLLVPPVTVVERVR